ncbi:hypothetical protein ACVLVH_003433 [Kluyvera sp. 1366]
MIIVRNPSEFIIAVYPTFRPLLGDWVLFNYSSNNDSSFRWRKRFDDYKEYMRVISYDSFEKANEAATEINEGLVKTINLLDCSDDIKSSLLLRADKAVTSRSRLLKEEELMLSVAQKKLEATPRPTIHDVNLSSYYISSDKDEILSELVGELNKNPLIRIAHLRKNRRILGLAPSDTHNNLWQDRYVRNDRTANIAHREIIARAFGLSGGDNWGKTKAEIRRFLLPRANELLQLASVKRLLAEAKLRGQKVLMAGGFVFWYEEKGNVGWIVKESNSNESSKSGETIWHEGTIISKNHGRIVVFPYIKENGECVQGHTKNAPHDGKAKPRHPDEYLELPFEVLDDDLMIGLFGELKYD